MHPQTRARMHLGTRIHLRPLPTAVVEEEIGEEIGERVELVAKASREMPRPAAA